MSKRIIGAALALAALTLPAAADEPYGQAEEAQAERLAKLARIYDGIPQANWAPEPDLRATTMGEPAEEAMTATGSAGEALRDLSSTQPEPSGR